MEWCSLTQTVIQAACARFWSSEQGIPKCTTQNFYKDAACTRYACFACRSQRANFCLQTNIHKILFHNVTLKRTMLRSKCNYANFVQKSVLTASKSKLPSNSVTTQIQSHTYQGWQREQWRLVTGEGAEAQWASETEEKINYKYLHRVQFGGGGGGWF